MDGEERREAAIEKTAAALQPDFKSQSITQTQLEKLKIQISVALLQTSNVENILEREVCIKCSHISRKTFNMRFSIFNIQLLVYYASFLSLNSGSVLRSYIEIHAL
ncbi:hypothetical protein IFM89_020703 [Coptis chinensis]|uniref:Uncharacterized protein n=1 Tax=Coptis chinensis TaxID=261450 RepID=A0A835H7W4_9MAGN|nr:hypothetical protein IFM89_020703 [Coptis chinensis]